MRPGETIDEYDDRMNRSAHRDFNAQNGQGRQLRQELVVREELAHPPAINHPLERDPKEFRASLVTRGENRNVLISWLKDALMPGVDFGKIHYVKKSVCARGAQCDNPNHFTKDTLFRPGAEKICGMLGVTPTYPNLGEYERAAIAGVQIRAIILRCQMTAVTGAVVSEGVGARSLEQDYGDLNKALKMAKKSAHIDAVLAMAGLSEIFTHPDVPPGAPGKADDPDPARVPMGQFRDQLWSEVSDMYLDGVIKSPKAPPVMKTGAQAEIDRRNAQVSFDDDIPF